MDDKLEGEAAGCCQKFLDFSVKYGWFQKINSEWSIEDAGCYLAIQHCPFCGTKLES